MTGINGLHTIWGGIKKNESDDKYFSQRDRVVADYAGWAKAGSDRILQLLGHREGILSLFGGSGSASIVLNMDQRICECSLGSVSQIINQELSVKAPVSNDHDGRPIQLLAFHGGKWTTPNLIPNQNPSDWNFMEIELLPQNDPPLMSLSIRSIIDAPTAPPKGGGTVQIRSSDTGRTSGSFLPETTLIPDADVQISHLNGDPIRATRTRADGTISITKLVDVFPDTSVLLTAYTPEDTLSTIATTISLPDST